MSPFSNQLHVLENIFRLSHIFSNLQSLEFIPLLTFFLVHDFPQFIFMNSWHLSDSYSCIHGTWKIHIHESIAFCRFIFMNFTNLQIHIHRVHTVHELKKNNYESVIWWKTEYVIWWKKGVVGCALCDFFTSVKNYPF